MRALLLAASAAAALGCSGSDSGPRAGPVTVTVTWGAPSAGLPVAFHRPDGSVQEVAVTDASGKATAVVAEGGLVTVGRPTWSSPNQWELTTVAGLAPGDDLALAQPWGDATTGEGTVTFAEPVNGASSYRVDAACTAAHADAGYVSPLPMVLGSSCGGAIDAIALARAPGGDLLAYAMATDAPIAGTAPTCTAEVVLGPWRTDFATLALDVIRPPAGAWMVWGVLEPRRSGRRFFQSAMGDGAALVPGGSASLALAYPAAFATSVRLVTTVQFAPPAGGDSDGAAWLVDPGAPLAPYLVDLAAYLPPRLSGAALSGAVATWSQAGPDPGLDGAILATLWMAGNGQHTWRVVLPPGATRFEFPSLPPELAEFAPGAGAGPTGFSVTAYDDAATSGYAGFKAGRLGLLFDARSNYDLALRATQTWTPTP